MPIYITPYAFFMFPIVYYPSHPFRGCNFLGVSVTRQGVNPFMPYSPISTNNLSRDIYNPLTTKTHGFSPVYLIYKSMRCFYTAIILA